MFASTWKYAAYLMAGLALTFAIAWGVTGLQRNSARSEAEALRASIEDPINGWRTRFRWSEANVSLLQDTLNQQNAAISDLEVESSARIAAAEQGWRDAQLAAAAARNRADRIGSAEIDGNTVCERVGSVDAQILEALR